MRTCGCAVSCLYPLPWHSLVLIECATIRRIGCDAHGHVNEDRDGRGRDPNGERVGVESAGAAAERSDRAHARAGGSDDNHTPLHGGARKEALQAASVARAPDHNGGDAVLFRPLDGRVDRLGAGFASNFSEMPLKEVGVKP